MLGLSRAALYYQAVQVHAYELELMALLDLQYLRTPFYGSWRMTAWLQTQSHAVNRKRVQCLMQRAGLARFTSARVPLFGTTLTSDHTPASGPQCASQAYCARPKSAGLRLPRPPDKGHPMGGSSYY